LGLLIRQTYCNIIYSVGVFNNSAARKLKSKTSEDMWERERRLKRGVWNHYQSFKVRSAHTRAAFKDKL